jgi:catalase
MTLEAGLRWPGHLGTKPRDARAACTLHDLGKVVSGFQAVVVQFAATSPVPGRNERRYRMAHSAETTIAPSDTLIRELLEGFDALFGLHPGFRPVHAKGVLCSGAFTPAAQATALTRAPHVGRSSTPVLVRFSDFAGVPTIADNDLGGAGPRGMAIRFQLAEHVHTDIIAHSENGFPTRTGGEFLEFLRAAAASGPDASKPTALDSFLATHPKVKHFLEAPKPIPSSFARESYFGVSALRFTDNAGASRFGRFRIHPQSGNDYLSAAEAAKKSANFLADELWQRLATEPVKMRVLVQMAAPGDELSDSTVVWPEDREQIEFGTIALNTPVNASDPEVHKIIFDPIPRVDGIEPSDDPLFELRAALYLLSGRRRRAAGSR